MRVFHPAAATLVLLALGACVTLEGTNLPAPVQEHASGARSGDAESQYRFGMDYTTGFGVAQDPARAVEWFRRAADQGHAGAAFMLGSAYGSGRGVAEDPVTALAWYEKAAAANHPRAQYLAAEAYANGRGTGQDLRRAVELYRKAADQGHPDAMFALGAMTAAGQGVKRDDAAAARWLLAAQARGRDADKEIAALKKRMPAAAFAKARRDAQAFLAAHPQASLSVPQRTP